MILSPLFITELGKKRHQKFIEIKINSSYIKDDILTPEMVCIKNHKSILIQKLKKTGKLFSGKDTR